MAIRQLLRTVSSIIKNLIIRQLLRTSQINQFVKPLVHVPQLLVPRDPFLLAQLRLWQSYLSQESL